jgi:hypothetical protein
MRQSEAWPELYIDLKDDKLTVEGRMYNANYTYRGKFKASAVNFGDDGDMFEGRPSGDKLLRYSYREWKEDGGAAVSHQEVFDGGAFYHFLKGKPNEFRGEFYNKRGEVCTLYGQRIEGNDADGIKSQDTKQIQELIRRKKFRSNAPDPGESAFLLKESESTN